MSLLLMGSNPGLGLYAAGVSGTLVAFASAWRVDWSTHGSGTAIVLWYEGRVRLVTQRPELGFWLADTFNRHFPEVAAVPWTEPELTDAPVTFELDSSAGVRVRAAEVVMEVSAPLDRRITITGSFPGNSLRLSNVYTPCRAGRLHVAGRRVLGDPRIKPALRPSSTAFLADAETWSEPTALPAT